MKKLLVGTTALVAAGMIAAPASAAEKITLSIAGFMEQYVGVADNDDSFESAGIGGEGVNFTGFDQQADSEVHFKGKTKLDNGIEVAVKMELESDTGGGGIDESVVMVGSDVIGEIWLGGEDTVSETLHHTAPDVGVGFLDSDPTNGNWIAAPAASTRENVTHYQPNDDGAKISYFSPRFFGFGLGATYVPDVNDGQATQNAQNTTADDAWAIAAVFENEFGGISLKADGFYGHTNGDDGNPLPSLDSAGTSAGTDRTEVGGGVNIGFAGFTVGGSYKRVIVDAIAAGGGAVQDGHVYAFGASYGVGPFAVSAAYMKSEKEGLVNNSGKDELTSYIVSGKYTMGPGVDLVASVFQTDFDDETAAVAANNDGWAAVGGFELKF